MPDWPVGISTGAFFNWSLMECLQPIRDGGFSMLEICSFPKHLDYHDSDAVKRAADCIENMGLEAYSLHAPFGDDIDISTFDCDGRAHAIRELELATWAAATLGVRNLVIHPGPEWAMDPPPGERLQRLCNAASVLDIIAGHCQEHGLRLVLENMLPHLMFGAVSDVLWLLGAMENITVGTCLDTGHAYLTGELYRVTYKLSGHLQMIHAADNHGQYDDHLPPGRGEIDWGHLLGMLDQTGFRGAVILELAGRDDRDAAAIMNAARSARRYLRGIGRQLDVQVPPTGWGPSSPL